MNEALKQQISAYVDGELSANESELLIRRLSQDAELRALAAQYIGIGRALRGEAGLAGMRALRENIAAELGEQPPESMPVEPAASNRVLRPVAGVAIAASVALLALVGLQRVSPTEPPVATASNDLAAIAIDEAPLYTEPPVAEIQSDRPSAMLTKYYQQHNVRAEDIGGNGIFPRLVELELRGDELSSTPAGQAGRDGEPQPAQTPDQTSDNRAGIDTGEQN